MGAGQASKDFERFSRLLPDSKRKKKCGRACHLGGSGSVSCRMVRRQLGSQGDSSAQFPLGSTQGTLSAMGYSQSWTMGSGSAGELYLSKLEKKLLGVGNRIGARSPLEGLCDDTRD